MHRSLGLEVLQPEELAVAEHLADIDRDVHLQAHAFAELRGGDGVYI